MRKIAAVVLLMAAWNCSDAQLKSKAIDGMYFQWGYNMEWYTRSNIHFKMQNGDHFTLERAKGRDKPDFEAIYKNPGDISIPQYNYRLGFYLNHSHTKAIEVNFDHIKYVVQDGQTVHVSGVLHGKTVNGDSVLNAVRFLHMEHTDGGNLLHINYVQQSTLLMTADKKRSLINFIWKAGAGINIPRTDFTFHGDRLNNNFHVAGFNISAEAGARIYPFKHIFLEFTGKTGYVNYLNALANTEKLKGNRVSHHFEYAEVIGLIGFDIKF